MILEDIKNAEIKLKEVYKKIDDMCFINSKKVLDAFHECNLSEIHFNSTTGYGYGDIGRDKIEEIYAKIFKTEDALVRNQFISGTHALTIALFAILRPGDTLLSISGKPYDTLDSVIGLNNNASSLKSFGVNYEQIDLVNDDFNYSEIEKRIKKGNIKMIAIQRSKGYSLRKSISLEKLGKVISLIKNIDSNIVIMVDNCYCELVCEKEPSEVGADLVVGSLIKNLGGGIASNGAYIVGRKKLIHLCSERLNMPGEAKEVGPSLGANKMILQGLYFAPFVVASSLKTACLTSLLLEQYGFNVEPKWNDDRVDIVQMIYFNNEGKLTKFVEGIQQGSAIDANVLPVKSRMPGYDDKIIMASGSFTQGSSIELSCDGPIREPYVAYMQGGITYEYGKLGIIRALENIKK